MRSVDELAARRMGMPVLRAGEACIQRQDGGEK
nr:MAG TPA: hypothetical protein [Caudoviricetes sp.]